MSDPNMQEFRARVTRLKKAHARGGGFDAPGTLSRADFVRPKLRRRPIFRTLLFVVAFLFGIKGALHQHLGPNAYEARIEELRQSGGIDAFQASFMQADPVTLMVSHALQRMMAKVV